MEKEPRLNNVLKDLSSQLKVRIIGPNCIGMFNGDNRLDCAFQGHERMLRPKNVMYPSSHKVGLLA